MPSQLRGEAPQASNSIKQPAELVGFITRRPGAGRCRLGSLTWEWFSTESRLDAGEMVSGDLLALQGLPAPPPTELLRRWPAEPWPSGGGRPPDSSQLPRFDS